MATKAKAAPAPPAGEQIAEPHDFVYVGQRLLADGKPGTALQLVGYEGGTQNLDNKLWLFGGTHGRKWLLGGIYTGAKFTESQCVGLPAAKFVKMYGEFEDRVEWIAKDTATHAELKYERLRKDATRMNEIERVMTPLREAYQDMWSRGDTDGMRALRVAVEVSLLRRGKTSNNALLES